MSLNMNFDEAIALRLDEIPWVPSPNGEVERRKLERQGEESGWATTVVRFPPKSYFPAHSHPEGEEYIVLEGTFSDESGDYHAGTYVRNVPSSRHQPFSENGCTILVKLCQMYPDELENLVVQNAFDQEEKLLLHQDTREEVSIETLEDGSTFEADGVEILVLSGTITRDDQAYPAPSWLRFPSGTKESLQVAQKAKLWLKRRDIRNEERLPYGKSR